MEENPARDAHIQRELASKLLHMVEDVAQMDLSSVDKDAITARLLQMMRYTADLHTTLATCHERIGQLLKGQAVIVAESSIPCECAEAADDKYADPPFERDFFVKRR
jgi:hypothetical protein